MPRRSLILAGGDLITPHPLGGCIGLNPSRTIAALAEHVAAALVAIL